MIHICPVEVSAFFMFYRDILLRHGGPLLRWLGNCCSKCCTHKKELWEKPAIKEHCLRSPMSQYYAIIMR